MWQSCLSRVLFFFFFFFFIILFRFSVLRISPSHDIIATLEQDFAIILIRWWCRAWHGRAPENGELAKVPAVLTRRLWLRRGISRLVKETCFNALRKRMIVCKFLILSYDTRSVVVSDKGLLCVANKDTDRRQLNKHVHSRVPRLTDKAAQTSFSFYSDGCSATNCRILDRSKILKVQPSAWKDVSE